MIKVNKNLVLFSGLFLFAGTILLLITEKFSPLINHVTYYCQSFINAHMTPIPYFLSIVPILLLGLLVAVSTLKLSFLLLKTQFIKKNLKKRILIKNKIVDLIKNLGLEGKVIVVKSSKKFAFCLGFRNPKIYLSSGLISKMSLRELEAILRHEQYHLENSDTLTLMIASFSQSLFPFFPIVGDLIKKYRVEREISADSFAASHIGNPNPLLSALRKLIAFPTVENFALAAIADQNTLEPRIYSLINRPYNQKSFQLKHFLITIFSLFTIGGIFISPIYAQEIHSENQDVVMLCDNGGKCLNSCASLQNINKSIKMSTNQKSNEKPSLL